jgi:hypothetical protein
MAGTTGLAAARSFRSRESVVPAVVDTVIDRRLCRR